jgi:hypothetical protein
MTTSVPHGRCDPALCPRDKGRKWALGEPQRTSRRSCVHKLPSNKLCLPQRS